MAKQITDDEDKLKRQARRRLIGAVALTTAIVVILPMVLENEPKPVGQDIELRIPDKDKVAAFVPKNRFATRQCARLCGFSPGTRRGSRARHCQPARACGNRIG